MKSFFLLFILSLNLLAVEQDLALDPARPDVLTKVDLPFRYRTISPGESMLYVAQGGAALMAKDSPFDHLLIGPLSPCFGIIIHNKQNQTTLAFHSYWVNNLESMITFYAHLAAKQPQDLLVTIYSVHAREVERHLDEMLDPWSQASELAQIADFVATKLKLNKEQISPRLYEVPARSFSLGRYKLAENWLLVTKSGEIFIIDPAAEGIFHFEDFDKQIPQLQLDIMRIGYALKPGEPLPFQFDVRELAPFKRGKTPFFFLDYDPRALHVWEKKQLGAGADEKKG